MWPEPLKEDGTYKYKGMVIKLHDDRLWELFKSGSGEQWMEMGRKEEYCLLIEELALCFGKQAK